jgi:hypothetical protein
MGLLKKRVSLSLSLSLSLSQSQYRFVCDACSVVCSVDLSRSFP